MKSDKKIALLFGASVLLIGGCGSSPEEIATMTAAAWTPTPIPSATPTPIPYDLTVTIQDESGAPLPGTTLVYPASGSETPVVTDDQGVYKWTNLPREGVNLEISAPGYFPQTVTQTMSRGANDIAVTLVRDPFGLTLAEACASGEKLLYIEDFQDGKAQGFQNITAATDFNAVNGWALGPLEEGNQVVSFTGVHENGDALADYTFENAVWRIKVRTTGKDGFSFLNWHFLQNPEGGSRYVVQWGADVLTDLSRLQMPTPGHFSVAPSRHKVIPDTWTLVEFSAYNDLIEVWVDGEQVAAYQDPQPLPTGSLGLEAHIFNDPNTVYYFDNLAVCELSAPFQSILPAP